MVHTYHLYIYTALIWYTGHGEKMTGNWCFKDGIISFEDIYNLYQKHFNGRMLTIVSDCCYSGQWTLMFAEKLDSLKVGACGHKANEAGIVLKVFAACMPNETAFDTIYAKKCVSITPSNNNLMMFFFNEIKINKCGRSQTPIAIDSTGTTCFSKDLCKFDQLPERVKWQWKDLVDRERRRRLGLQLFRLWSRKNQLPRWSYIIVFDDKFEEFCELAKSGQLFDEDMYGHTVFSGYGRTPTQEAKELFCQFGPKAVKLPENEPSIPGAHVHSLK